MPISSVRLFLSVAVLGSALALPAQALDPTADGHAVKRNPLEMFSLGFSAYKRGEKVEAFEALRYAAEGGHAGARWKLGQMYADGDGVPENDFEAFKMFEQIVRDQQDDTSSSPNAAYVSSAVVAMAQYLRDGIPGTPVQADAGEARNLYAHAASYFGDPRAQFELGRMLLSGEGGKANPRQAARWLALAARKGYVKAEALLGYLIFDGERIEVRAEPARGLAMLTHAMQNATPDDLVWIRPLQEEVFSLATEADRRTAIASVEDRTPVQ